MALPKNFKLKNFDWKINHCDQDYIDKNMIDQGSPGSFGGFCDCRNLEIAVSKSRPKQRLPRTVLHEVIHACFNETRILDFDTEEKVTVLLEERLTDLIKNNPKLIKYFQENL